MTLLPPLTAIPFPEKRLITSPRTAQLDVLMVKPFPAPAFKPFNSTTGVPAKSGWLFPFIVTPSVIALSHPEGVPLMVQLCRLWLW